MWCLYKLQRHADPGSQVLAGGERRSIEEALPFYKQISGRLYHVGEHADAVHMKSIHQVVGLSNFLAGVEIMQIGRDYGFDSRVSFVSITSGHHADKIRVYSMPSWQQMPGTGI